MNTTTLPIAAALIELHVRSETALQALTDAIAAIPEPTRDDDPIRAQTIRLRASIGQELRKLAAAVVATPATAEQHQDFLAAMVTPRFVSTETGLINPANVARIERDRANDQWRFYNDDGKLLGVADWGFDPFSLDTSYVPVSGLTAIEIVVVEERDSRKRPTEANIECHRVPVVAWPVDDDPSKVVFADSIGGDWVLEMPDGKLREPYVGFFYNLEAAKAWALEQAQDRWDNEHGPDADVPSPTSPIIGHA